jgi:hypothetical protein
MGDWCAFNVLSSAFTSTLSLLGDISNQSKSYATQEEGEGRTDENEKQMNNLHWSKIQL